MIRFFVAGIPAPKGSSRAFFVKALKRSVITNANAKTRPWEQAVRAEAQAAGCSRLVGPVRVELTFVFPRPQSHLRANGTLKPSAPAHHTKKPDVDKLVRTILDALTAVAFNDDAQVVDARGRKRYLLDLDAQPGVAIEVDSLDAAAIESCPEADDA